MINFSAKRALRSRLAIGAVLVTALLTTTGCANLVRPNFSTEISTLRAGQYSLDPLHTFINWRVGHLDLSKIIGRFNSVEASLDFDPENPSGLQLQGRIDPTSIDMNNTELETQLQEPAWFSSGDFPTIAFNSSATTVAENGDMNIVGELTLRGVSKPVTISARFNGGADNILTRKYTIGFSATAQFNRSDFGMDSFSAFIGDLVEVELHGEFQRNSP